MSRVLDYDHDKALAHVTAGVARLRPHCTMATRADVKKNSRVGRKIPNKQTHFSIARVYMYLQQEAHGPHRSPEKTVQIN